MTIGKLYSTSRSTVYRLNDTTTSRILLPSDSNPDGLGIVHHSMAAGAPGADPHYHKKFQEAFYVLGGDVEVHDGSAWLPATTGDLLFVPREAVHGFRNASDSTAEMLIIFAPGRGRESFFRDLAERYAGRIHDSFDEIAARNDQYDATQ